MTQTPAASDRKRGRPTDQEREEREDQILDCAVNLFVRKGYGQTSIDELAADARVTKRTIYSYFGDKSGVFAAAIERFRRNTLPDVAETTESLDQLAARIVHTLHSEQAVQLHRLIIAESPQFPAVAADFYASGPQGYIDLLRSRLSHASAVPESADLNTAFTAEALFGLLLGERHRQRLLGLRPAPDQAEAERYAHDTLLMLGVAVS